MSTTVTTRYEETRNGVKTVRYEETINGVKTVRYEETRDGVKPVRYVQGWRDPEQDRKPPPKVAHIISQDYEVIKRECLAQGALWQDPSFPATDKSIYPRGRASKPLEWRRPGDLCKNPQMFVDGFERSDIKQGELGNCWFLAAIASLCTTKNEDLFYQVVPRDNQFGRDYAGVFHFKLWRYGNWVDVVVDDQLPTLEGRQLAFVRSPSDNEFWPALLEKAYAKLHGSYEALVKGSSAEAMQDFIGGVTEAFSLGKDVPKDLFKIMRKALDRDSLVGCSVGSEHSGADREGLLPNGLVVAHAYSITSVKKITVRGDIVNLVRVRNPWGKDEWNGAWSDGSREWKMLSEADKKSLGLTFKDGEEFWQNDGEFWISYNDFVKNFNQVEMCMTIVAYGDIRLRVGSQIQWEMTLHEGSWKKYVNAGGCANPPTTTFWTNPQYKVRVVAADEDEEDNTGTLIVAIMQKDRRKQIVELGHELLSIGYYIYKIPDNHVGPQNQEFFKWNKSVANSSTYIAKREVVGRHKLPQGSYLIIPTTFKPNEEGDFVLRIFSEKLAPAEEIDEDTRVIDRTDDKVTVTQTDRDEERELQDLFTRTAGSDLEVDAYELRSILDSQLRAEFKIEGVSLETARSMVAMMDFDHSGKLGYDEFKILWTDLRRWKKVFLKYDVSKTNSLSAFEMRAALNSSGFMVRNQTLNCLVMRYSDPKGNIQFDDFMLCVVKLKTMFENFRELGNNKKNATFTLDQFIQTTMYA